MTYFVPHDQKSLGVVTLPDRGEFYIASATPIQPNPADYVKILQRVGKLPPGDFLVHEIGPKECFTQRGEIIVRGITLVSITP